MMDDWLERAGVGGRGAVRAVGGSRLESGSRETSNVQLTSRHLTGAGSGERGGPPWPIMATRR